MLLAKNSLRCELPVRPMPRGFQLLLLLCACSLPLSAADARTEGTRQMAELLARLAAAANPTNHPFLNEQRADMFAREIMVLLAQPNPSPAVLVNLRGKHALELLQAGRSEEAILEFERALELHRSPSGAHFMGRRDETMLRTYLALSHLRLGEQENCLSNHTTLSCILPIERTAQHKFERGSRGAIKVLREQLTDRPNDLQARWLLNIAHMTLGEYPDKVPQAHLIPPRSFESEFEIGKFKDIAGDLGLDVPELSGGSIAEDFDGDGDLDIAASSLGLTHQLRYFQNNGDGTFTDATIHAGLEGIVGGLNLMQTDYDNDGWADIFVLRGGWFGTQGKHPKSLLRNRGDGTFEDVTVATGLLSFHPTQTATWFDYNGDGWLDVFIGHESRDGDTNLCQLFRNERGTFVECAAASGVAVAGWVKGVASGDYNNDGRPDLYISRLGEANLLFRNDGGGPGKQSWKFTDVTAFAGVAEPRYSFPTWFFDYNNDGWEDIFVAGYRAQNVGDVAADYLGLPHDAERPRLYRNQGNGTFADVTKECGLYRMLLAMGSNFGDLDNDGWLDFYLGTGEPDLSALMPNRMFRNAHGTRFQDVTTSGGFGHLQKGHGVSFGDFDQDGDQDIYQVIGGAFSGDTYRNVLFENPGHGHGWVKLKLIGSRSNRPAIGARVQATISEAGSRRVIHRTVSSGGSFGASPFTLEIGLGKSERIDRLELLWPGSGTQQSFTNVPIRNVVVIREGNDTFQASVQRGFKFRKRSGSHHH